MKKILSAFIALGFMIPQWGFAQFPEVSATQRAAEVAKRVQALGDTEDELRSLQSQLSSKTWRNGGYILLSAAALTALVRAAKYTGENPGLVQRMLASRPAQYGAIPAFGTLALMSFAMGAQEITEMRNWIDQASADVERQRNDLRDAYQYSRPQ